MDISKRGLLLAAVLFFLLFTWAKVEALPWGDYAPACQWLRLRGEVQRPASLKKSDPVFLSVYFRIAEQKNPSPLLINYPLYQDRFLFVLSGFKENIDGVWFLPYLFNLKKNIEFEYYAASRDQHWKSSLFRSSYIAERYQEDDRILCKTDIRLEPLILLKQSLLFK